MLNKRVLVSALSAAFLCGLLAPASSRSTPLLVKDIETSVDPDSDSDPSDAVAVGGTIYFVADDGIHGRELWRSDGTRDGTWMVEDINPGERSGSPALLTPYENGLIFTAGNTFDGCGVWRSDGTAEGTTRLGTFIPGRLNCFYPAGYIGPEDLTLHDGDVFFTSVQSNGPFSNGTHEIWRTDGTPTGTVRAVELGEDFRATGLLSSGNILFFVGQDMEHGAELWKSDATEAGTVLVRDIRPGPEDSVSTDRELVGVGAFVLFAASDRAHGDELWRSDGTEEGTELVADLYAGAAGSLADSTFYPRPLLVPFGSQVVFPAFTSSGPGLWRSDGTPEGTVALLPGDLHQFPYETTADEDLAFFVLPRGGAYGLWRTDGTPVGTGEVVSLVPGLPVAMFGEPGPPVMVAHGGGVFFVADDGAHGCELWISDGTPKGTRLTADVDSEATPCSMTRPVPLATAGGRLFYRLADETRGGELWASDGTEAGTRLVRDINDAESRTADAFRDEFFTPWIGTAGDLVFFAVVRPGGATALWRSNGTESGTFALADISPRRGAAALDGVLVFAAEDDEHGLEVWRSDGTIKGTYMLADIEPEPFRGSAPEGFTVFGGRILFAARTDNQIRLWRTDGSPEATEPLAVIGGLSSPLSMGDRLFFSATVETSSLWVTDGTGAGTELLAVGGDTSTLFGEPRAAVLHGLLFFAAGDTVSGSELWVTEGTPASTRLVRDIRPGRQGSSPSSLVAFADLLFFAADDGESGRQLWVSDGTTEGTHLAEDIDPGPEGLSPARLTVAGSQLFFVADTPQTGPTLWMKASPATDAVLLKDFRSGPRSGRFEIGDEFVTIGHEIFFVADDGATGPELWTSDGTGEGTHVVRDVDPRSFDELFSGFSLELDVVDDEVLFVAYNDAVGDEHWRSDGSRLGTVPLEAAAGPVSSASYLTPPFIETDSHVFFLANDGATGLELWAMPRTDLTEKCLGDCNKDRRVSVDELVIGVTMSLEQASLSECAAFDPDRDGAIEIDELVGSINRALRGCSAL